MATRKRSKPTANITAFQLNNQPLVEEHRLRTENRELRRQLDEAVQSRVLDEDYERFIGRILRRKVTPPTWSLPKRTLKRHEVVPVTNCSDWHFDEVVRPEEVQMRNGFNREIADKRYALYWQNVVKVAHTYVHGFHYPGIMVNFLGDMFSGFIHEELAQTNADTMIGSLLHWIKPTVAGLRLMADQFGQVWVTGVVGNHSRMTKKPRAKFRARDNFDWLFYQLVARELEGDSRFTWHIGDGQKLQCAVYDHRFMLSHGDECRGGSGIAGMLSPQLIAMARMRKIYTFDTWLLGHWHYRAAYRGIRVNGSGKGYDEYAALNNFDFQVPQQDLFLVAPGRGIIADWPVFCQLETEPWAEPVKPGAAFSK